MEAVHHLEMMCGPHQSEYWVQSIKGGLQPCGLVSSSDWYMTLSLCLKLRPFQSVSFSTAASLPKNYYRIVGKFGEEFNLANWRGILKNAKLKVANLKYFERYASANIYIPTAHLL